MTFQIWCPEGRRLDGADHHGELAASHAIRREGRCAAPLPRRADGAAAAASRRAYEHHDGYGAKKRACEEARTVSYLKSQKRHAPFLNATVS